MLLKSIHPSMIIHSFIRSFVRSFLRSFVPSFLRSFVPSFLRSFVPSFLRSFVSFVRSFVRSFVDSIIRLFVHSIICSFICRGEHWGILETTKPKKNSSKTAKPKTAYKTVKTLHTNFIEVFIVNDRDFSEAFVNIFSHLLKSQALFLPLSRAQTNLPKNRLIFRNVAGNGA